MITLRIDGATHRFSGPNAEADCDAFLRDQERADSRRPRAADAKERLNQVPRKRVAVRLKEIMAVLPAQGSQGLCVDDVAKQFGLSYWTARDLMRQLQGSKSVHVVRDGLIKRFTRREEAAS